IVERFTGIICAAVFAVIALFLGFTTIGNQSIVIPIVIFFVICVAIAIMIIKPSIFGIDKLFNKFNFLQKIREKLSSVFNTFESFKDYKMELFKVLIYSFLLQFAVILNYYLAALAVGIDLDLTAFLFMVPVISIITMIPVSIGGIGLRENAIVIIMNSLGVMEERAAVCSLLILVMLLIVGIIGGIAYIIRPYFEKHAAVEGK
ncbi:MAG: lysylphosphatidylglycerol synthase transmembrane domain-containing protein, partial [Actinomycetota bacterium]|nr:lysylphosphatidylglycerol synthase transmembrane domain-containing protein [Actinomycetota bacterium]